ncbi:MAG: type I 3-dehydroquinate dehydratase [Holdemanella sp.]|nr:type I 3-dehydroquinate dehydratase [Holdemanella sp.]
MTIWIRNIEIDKGMPKICIPFMPETFHDIEKEWNTIKDYDFDILEWRMDSYKENHIEAIQKIRKLVDKPLLSTLRTSFEGGQMDVTFTQYLTINKDVMDSGCTDLIDVEAFLDEDTIKKLVDYAHSRNIYVIGSNHDFNKTPDYDEIINRFHSMKEKQVDFVKAAYMPTCKEDVLNVLLATYDFKRKNDMPIISMAMSDKGMISRVIGELTGSCITFGCIGKASAPGQIECNDLKAMLRIVHDSM